MKLEKWIILVTLCLGMSACNQPSALPTSVLGSSQSWIDDPLPNSVLSLTPYKLVFHGTSLYGATEFELEINGVVIATVPPVSSSSGGSQKGTLFLGEYLWTPPAPGTYLIAVRAKGNGQFSTPALVQVTVDGNKVELIAPQPLAQTPTATSVEAKECTFIALVDLFCRLGPGVGYTEVDYFFPEQSAPIIGQSADSFFWYVISPRSGKVCTVPNAPQIGKTEGDCSVLPMFTPMPLPTLTYTPEPTPTSTPCTTGILCP